MKVRRDDESILYMKNAHFHVHQIIIEENVITLMNELCIKLIFVIHITELFNYCFGFMYYIKM